MAHGGGGRRCSSTQKKVAITLMTQLVIIKLFHTFSTTVVATFAPLCMPTGLCSTAQTTSDKLMANKKHEKKNGGNGITAKLSTVTTSLDLSDGDQSDAH